MTIKHLKRASRVSEGKANIATIMSNTLLFSVVCLDTHFMAYFNGIGNRLRIEQG